MNKLPVILAHLFCAPILLGAPEDYFTIQVVDEQTRRGVPLVELSTVSDIVWWTDSNGIVAFDEPGLFGEEVFLHLRSHGYEYHKDGFGYRGLTVRPIRGGSLVIPIKRLNIAERLYRVTGQGIYRDSLLTGRAVPLRQPLLNGQVTGQDTVIVAPYRGKLYWFWGDTDRVSYPLGNFAVSGATSEWPGRGGLSPQLGVDLNYFTDAAGFSKKMCPGFGPGLHWIETVLTLPDETGRERLIARVSSQKGLEPAYAWHLAVFNDEKEIFESRVQWDLREGHDSSHPFVARVDGADYFYLYPNWRVKADWQSLTNLAIYEAFTCVAGEGRVRGDQTEIARGADGHPHYAWKAGADRLHPGRLRELVRRGKLKPEESWLQLLDVETGHPVSAGRGSVFWNAYRQRWVMLMTSQPGEVWFAEGDTPTGPWVYARRVVAHDQYNFYNPTQHPFFDQADGRVIFFEGTYTASFSAAKAKTPRYDYNQIMYRLTLDDPRLNLPVPIYELKDKNGALLYLPREEVHESRGQIQRVAFFALPPDRGLGGTVPIFAKPREGMSTLDDSPPQPGQRPLFFALPLASAAVDFANGGSPSVVPLYEHQTGTGLIFYSTEKPIDAAPPSQGKPICQVWRSPMKVLPLDWTAQPAAPPRTAVNQ